MFSIILAVLEIFHMGSEEAQGVSYCWKDWQELYYITLKQGRIFSY